MRRGGGVHTENLGLERITGDAVTEESGTKKKMNTRGGNSKIQEMKKDKWI